ncbi:STAS domain-containing protein [Actinoplanes sp. NPDC024001]|uniref:STAS domain-containing protein n=1 Tax=Actinoplanes sp. NPDC024001 TaxID=3154598 RepID=UPI0033FE1E2E
MGDTGFENHLLAYARLVDPCTATVVATSDAGRLVIAVSGSIDVQASATVADQLGRMIGAGDHERVVLDLSGVEFCDCAGARALLAVHELAEAAGIACTVEGPRPHIRWLLELTGVAAVLGLTPQG